MLVITIFLVLSAFAVAEFHWNLQNGIKHDFNEVFSSLILGAMNILSNSIFQPIPLVLIALSTEFQLTSIAGPGLFLWIACFVLDDFVAYWMHRIAHITGWGWIDHFAHHTPKEYNLSVALRLGSVGAITPSVLAPIPLVLLGFPPEMIFICHGINGIYQFFLHTENVGRLPAVVEYIFNTPTHHRVHHSSSEFHLDKNFGGVFIVWDRMFGTFSGQGSALIVYGTSDSFESSNPLRIAFEPLFLMLRALYRSRDSLLAMAQVLFGKPVDRWSDD